MAKRKQTEAERAARKALLERADADARHLRTLAEKAQAALDAQRRAEGA